MLPTFVIGLREGLEASLIVGIVAAFLAQQGRRDALRWMWVGIVGAALVCLAVGIALREAGQELPRKEQEGLETVIAIVAVGFVTWMIIWMKQNARTLSKDLRTSAAAALAAGSAFGLVAMAFLAVLREGLETAVFLVAAFNASGNATEAAGGAVLGLVIAIGIGFGIYKGGITLNLTKFFKVTGVLLAFVAAGLLSRALHTAHEAGWFDALQKQAIDLTGVIPSGSVGESIWNGIIGLTVRPTVGELGIYLVYLVPLVAFVVITQRTKPEGGRQVSPTLAASSVVGIATVVIAGVGLFGSDKTTPSAQAQAAGGGSKTIDISLTDAGCGTALNAGAGPTTFKVTNAGTRKVTEYEVMQGGQILGEAENVAPGIPGSFSLTLAPGEYEIACPGGDVATGTLSVTGADTTRSGADADAVANYRAFLEQQTDELSTRTKAFTDAVRAGDLAKVKSLFASAREPYEAIEPVAEAFGDLDPKIDARVNDVEPGTKWTGFHRIEQAAFKNGSLKGMTPIADALDTDVADLVAKVKTVKLEPAQIGNGAVELLGEVSKSKITGEEDRYSHTDLSDFKGNVDGAQAAFKALHGILGDRDPALTKQIDDAFAAVYTSLKPYESGDGYVSYTKLTAADKRTLSQTIDRLAEPLSQVPALVVVAAQEQSETPADKAVSTYRKYLEQQTALLSTRTKAFTDAVRAGDLAKTKALFASTREPYEAIEPVAEAFGDLDPKIDARVNDVEPGAKWTGFHRIEQAAFKDESLSGMTPYADGLDTDVADLVAKVQTVKLEPAQIANGAVELLGEVSKSKITGEEDRYSHTDLMDFQGNVDGAKEAFTAVHGIIGTRDAALTTQIDDAFTAVYAALKPFKRGDGYVTYTDLTAADKRTLSQTIDRLAEPLSKVPALVVG